MKIKRKVETGKVDPHAKARKALEGIRNRQEKKGGDYKFFEIKTGKNRIRVLPPWKKGEPFFREVFMHRDVGPTKAFLVCPKKTEGDHEKKCPICKEADRMRAGGKKKAAYALNPKARYYMNMVDRDDEDAGVQVLAVGSTVAGKLIAWAEDPDDGGDLTDVKHGNDVLLIKVGKGLKTSYDDTKIKEAKTPLGDNTKELLEGLVDLDKLANPKTYEEIKAVLEGVEYEDAEGEAGSEEAESKESESESEEAESEEAEVDLDEMDRAELKAYIKENDLEIVVMKNWEDDEIREKIREVSEESEEAESEETSKPKKLACFGDADEFDPTEKTCQKCKHKDKCEEKMDA